MLLRGSGSAYAASKFSKCLLLFSLTLTLKNDQTLHPPNPDDDDDTEAAAAAINCATLFPLDVLSSFRQRARAPAPPPGPLLLDLR